VIPRRTLRPLVDRLASLEDFWMRLGTFWPLATVEKWKAALAENGYERQNILTLARHPFLPSAARVSRSAGMETKHLITREAFLSPSSFCDDAVIERHRTEYPCAQAAQAAGYPALHHRLGNHQRVAACTAKHSPISRRPGPGR
jgi:hypothetical protein